MNKSSSCLNNSLFNTIYVEKKAYEYPITKKILQKYSASTIIPVGHYKDVFNRPNQNFRFQKQNQTLILAVKDSHFLYKGPEVCQNFGHSNFYYTSFLLNCLFDCEYCYLQGMYASANIVAFVNIEDFKTAIKDITLKDPIFLAASYDTDVIAFQNIIPYMDYFYDFFANEKNLTVEVRTKSANQTFYKNHDPLDNVIIAFTLAPDDAIKKYEKYTPSLEIRIKAVQTAIENGFRVRLCLDPIFIDKDIDHAYNSFYNYIFTQISPDKIVDVGYGFFRISKEFYKRINKQFEYSRLFSEEYFIDGDVVSYPVPLQAEIMSKHFEILTQYIKKERIFSL